MQNSSEAVPSQAYGLATGQSISNGLFGEPQEKSEKQRQGREHCQRQ
jgi:hypothetical protein